jgi:hypothetical protein
MTALRDFRLLTPDRDIRKSRYQTFHSSTAGGWLGSTESDASGSPGSPLNGATRPGMR